MKRVALRKRRPLPAAREVVVGGPPIVLARPEVVSSIGDATASAGGCETGGPLLGTVQQSWDGASFQHVISILGTVPPGAGVRGTACSVGLGEDVDGERAASALRWLRAATGLQLAHVGDWHLHPLGPAAPSGGDVRTAQALAADVAPLPWLVAVVAARSVSKRNLGLDNGSLRHIHDSSQALELGVFRTAGTGLVPVRVRFEPRALPGLPPLPWHVVDRARFVAECRLLHAEGFTVDIEDPRPGVTPGLTLRLSKNGSRPVHVVTGIAYPSQEPVLLDGRGKRRTPSSWSADRFLLDLVREARR